MMYVLRTYVLSMRIMALGSGIQVGRYLPVLCSEFSRVRRDWGDMGRDDEKSCSKESFVLHLVGALSRLPTLPTSRRCGEHPILKRSVTTMCCVCPTQLGPL